MLDIIYQFFRDTIFDSNAFNNINLPQIEYFGRAMTFKEWLSWTSATITIIFIFVLCCLFIYKIIKLVGGLIR